MRELDLLLDRFLESQYDFMTDAERELFATFLEEPNQKIIDWLLENAEPDGRYIGLIERIQSYGSSVNQK
uniref:FAD assembly factor SdhE n=1 Tax=Candidatus Kentrum sp. MB TaxID=2138164 RepID=A0A450XUK2_9GAMM|nr:MAG: Flavinator of succinate dehydrogenase [Candidatus Kentron sp. MB]VFK75820.1 MAG: Flavinator of succinate dehydrogenase [Candidatus Kentron sp. MB]